MEQYMLYGKAHTHDQVKAFLDKYEHEVLSAGPWHRTKHVLDLLPRKAENVLDFGCGWGMFSNLIARHLPQAEVLGIDPAPESLRIARGFYGQSERLRFEPGPISLLCEESYDAVVSMQVIEHVHNPGIYLSSINRVLAPGGALVISLPNALTFKNLSFLCLNSTTGMIRRLKQRSEHILEHYAKEQDHINNWDPFHFTTLAASLGFALETVRPVEGSPVPFPNRKRTLKWRTRLFGLRNASDKMVYRLIKRDYCPVECDS
jgi:2-polyprenyl-3-methyl-5-hydroxy-6-metoxy-1,4-benzoquinol methylase